MEANSVADPRDQRFNRRWEDGVPHDPRTLEIFESVAALDFRLNSDYFSWRWGGDGDNGEIFMFVLDEYLQRRDEANETLAANLNELGAKLGFEPGSNKEILTVPAFVNFDTVTVGKQTAKWSNEQNAWVPG